MNTCSICATPATELTGILCRVCASAIGGTLAGAERRAPGIVSSHHAVDDAAAWLVDAWGQLHPIAARSRVGRERAGNDVVIADLLVSAEHAELRNERGRWLVRDRGSANGTGIADGQRVREAELAHRGRVWFGGIEFYFWGEAEPPVRDVPPVKVQTLVPDLAAFSLVKKARGEVCAKQAIGHPPARAPGELHYLAGEGSGSNERGQRVALARLQFQLLRVLCEGALRGGDGFVGTHELLSSLPFHTPQPEANHVRQVVASLRATLERAGVPGGAAASADGVIHATEGRGYRVTWEVRRVPAKK